MVKGLGPLGFSLGKMLLKDLYIPFQNSESTCTSLKTLYRTYRLIP